MGSKLRRLLLGSEVWQRCPSQPAVTSGPGESTAPSHWSARAVVLKLFHVEDPQIDTFQSADPQLKRYARDPHIREDF